MMYGLKIVDGDLAVRGDGNITEVSGRSRLEQEITHWLIEPLGTDTLYSRFGSTLNNSIGSPMIKEYISEVRSEIARVLNNYVLYQKRQVNEAMLKGDSYFLKTWKKEDIIETVNEIEIKAVADTLKVKIKLTTADGATTTLTRYI